MTPYEQGRLVALTKLGLGPSAMSAAGASPAPVAAAAKVNPAQPKAPGVGKPTKPQLGWADPNKMQNKMHEGAWSSAKEELGKAEQRTTAKVDQWQQPSPLPTTGA